LANKRIIDSRCFFVSFGAPSASVLGAGADQVAATRRPPRARWQALPDSPGILRPGEGHHTSVIRNLWSKTLHRPLHSSTCFLGPIPMLIFLFLVFLCCVWHVFHQVYGSSPQLPSGYATMIAVSLIPPLWRAVMHPRLLVHRKAQEGQVWRHGPTPKAD